MKLQYLIITFLTYGHFTESLGTTIQDFITSKNASGSQIKDTANFDTDLVHNKSAIFVRQNSRKASSIHPAQLFDEKPKSNLEMQLLNCKVRMQVIQWKQKNLPNISTDQESYKMSGDQVPVNDAENCVTSSEMAREFAQLRDDFETLRLAKLEIEQRLQRLSLEHKFQVNKLKHEKLVLDEELSVYRKKEVGSLIDGSEDIKHLYETVSNQTLQLYQDNIHLKFINSELNKTINILKIRLQYISKENELLKDNMIELSQENFALKEKHDENIANSSRQLLIGLDEKKIATERNQLSSNDIKLQLHELHKRVFKIESTLLINETDSMKVNISEQKSWEEKCKHKIERINVIRQNNRYYYVSWFSLEMESWASAQSSCESRGFELVSIESKEENDHIASIFQLYKSPDVKSWWLGGISDKNSKSSFRWSGSNNVFNFTRWSDTYESSTSDSKCVEMLVSDSWRIVDCDKLNFYLCEMKDEFCNSIIGSNFDQTQRIKNITK